ncbi:hypothetical protein [Desulfosporosinus youngiae]|uniref:Uncharacterized protein n=1 Tax=Desulfosporosinus youngiae DSM 17734 TaxID=768710 RepID=H5XYY3_9FIRM|nr:hypothetical protein [Desulfosporosinus youngiae]EHQ91689.1 hypothetical protein DesyoDRAFT_4743 [Desulfosporosinus youngiae DSM 17734]
MWNIINNGLTIGTEGSESGIILKDEEHCEGARITLEKDAHDIPFAITCSIYGLMMHTTFAGSEQEALGKYDEMKQCIQSFLSTDASEEEISNWCGLFTNKF